MKKNLYFLMILTMLLGLLSGCGGSKGEMPEEKNSAPVEEEPTEAPPVEEPVIAPTPTVFFGVEANTVVPQWDEFVFEQNPVAAAAAYVDLLQNAFGFTVTEQSTDDQASRWSLQYGDNENAGLDISSVFTQAEKYVVTVIYSQSIRWQDGAVYDWPEQTKEDAFAPDPEFFLNIGADSVEGGHWVFTLEGKPGLMALEYIDILSTVYGMAEVDSYIAEEACSWRLRKGDDEDATIRLDLDRRGDGLWEVRFDFGTHVTPVQAETWSGDGKEEPEDAAQGSAMNDPSVLPDFLDYGASAGFRQGTTSSDDAVVFLSEADSAWDVAEAYVQRLLDMGYWVSDTEEKSNQFMDVYRWYLTHDDVDGSAVKGSAQVYVKYMISIPYKSDDPHTEVSITFGSGVTYGGDSKTGSGSSGGSSSSGGSFTPEFAKLDCLTCKGSGNCKTCGGYGEVRKYAGAGESVRAKCDTCRGSGNCKACGGSGKR